MLIFSDIEHAVKKQFIARALLENDCKAEKAGKAVGLARRAMQDWIKAFGFREWRALVEASGIGPLEASWEEAYERLTRARLMAALDVKEWNVRATAQSLGICHRTVNYKMQEYGWTKTVVREVQVRA